MKSNQCQSLDQVPNAGFTLLELLVAIAVFAVLSTMAYDGLRSVLEVRHKSQTRAEQLARVQMAMLILEKDVEQAIPRTIRGAYGDTQPVFFGGGGDLLEFTRTGAIPPPGQGNLLVLRRVAYVVRGTEIYRVVWSVLDRAPKSSSRESIILSGVNSAEVRFLNRDGLWEQQWPPVVSESETNPPLLPKAVEFSFDLNGWGKIRRVFRVPGLG